jgi:PhzF family phenazine biosynthesis protein
MQAFARWTNLSETSFLLRPTDPRADYRLRIFTPARELPFAGHPTLGSAHAWLEAGGVPREGDPLVQQCAAGLVSLRREAGRLAFQAPPVRIEPVEDRLRREVVTALQLAPEAVCDARWLDNGVRWLALRLADAEQVLSARPDHAALRQLAAVGLIGPHPAGAACQFEVRAFADPWGVPEDPATGSLQASLAHWLMDEGAAPAAFVAAQGQCLGRDARIHLQRSEGALWVGGDASTAVHGTLDL